MLSRRWLDNGGAYDKPQSTAPQALAHALADSPVGQLGSNAQLLGPNHAADKPTEPTTVPLGLANFAWDLQSIRPFAERDHKNIVSWHVYDKGSHFAAHDAPRPAGERHPRLLSPTPLTHTQQVRAASARRTYP
ncbi:hypothetical protein ABTW72_02945 [Micromonospora sp. NPDC127501]|uniref:hypothetical protein n=1 Tax=Micromonospora sp. NPDC127501 TaxID=3154872 RepID=UPI003321E473